MNSKSKKLQDLGIVDWHLWPIDPSNLPMEPGIYVFRFRKEFPRLRGETDILYIGSTRDNGVLHDAIARYLVSDATQTTNWRINSLLTNERYQNKVEIAWSRLQENANTEKQKLLTNFEESHDELPPWNRSNSQ